MRSTPIVVTALILASCRGDGGARAPAPAAALAAPAYADRRQDPPANPTGLYWEGERLWVWSDSHRVQRSYERGEDGYQAGPVREGPAGTERCLGGRAELQGHTYCVGRYQNGGLVAFAHGSSAARVFGSLPARGGFRDLVLMHELGLLGVLDAVTGQLLWLDRTGARVGQYALPTFSYRIGSAGGDRIFVLSGGDPKLSVLRVGAGGSTQPIAGLQRAAPLRDAHYDEANDLLWLTGPEDHPVRRNRGPIEHLGSELLALDGSALSSGAFRVQTRFDLTALGLADPTRMTSSAGQLFVSMTGSDRLAWAGRSGDAWELHVTGTGLAPAGLAGQGRALAVAARLEDRIYVYDLGSDGRTARMAAPERITLDARARDSARDVGERLFYGALLWSQARERPFTCNSCHWETETDRRKHPGLREKRFEQTRPVGAAGALSPIFTPGQARTLDEAVDGLVRVLDDEYWSDRAFEERAIEVRVKDGSVRRLGPVETRRALSAFLATVPVSPGPYLRAEAPDLRALIAHGARLFIEGCADCHAPAGPNGRAAMRSGEALVDALKQRPLVLGATGFARAGAGPSFTDLGNRISPLMGLGRGGPYFASGSATSLQAVVAGFTRTRPGVHAATQGSVYDAQQRAALEAFLHSL